MSYDIASAVKFTNACFDADISKYGAQPLTINALYNYIQNLSGEYYWGLYHSAQNNNRGAEQCVLSNKDLIVDVQLKAKPVKTVLPLQWTNHNFWFGSVCGAIDVQARVSLQLDMKGCADQGNSKSLSDFLVKMGVFMEGLVAGGRKCYWKLTNCFNIGKGLDDIVIYFENSMDAKGRSDFTTGLTKAVGDYLDNTLSSPTALQIPGMIRLGNGGVFYADQPNTEKDVVINCYHTMSSYVMFKMDGSHGDCMSKCAALARILHKTKDAKFLQTFNDLMTVIHDFSNNDDVAVEAVWFARL